MCHSRNSLYYIEIVFDLFYNHVVLHEINYTIHLSVSYWWTFPSFVITNSAMMNNLQHTYLFIFLPMCFRGRTLGVDVTFQGEKIYTILLATVQFPSIRTTILVELHQQCLRACCPTTSQNEYAINFWISANLIGDKQYLCVFLIGFFSLFMSDQFFTW